MECDDVHIEFQYNIRLQGLNTEMEWKEWKSESFE